LIKERNLTEGGIKQNQMANNTTDITAEEFVTWLKGYLDGLDKSKLDYQTWDPIREKLIYVKKEDNL
jgi:hypothetical protein